MGIDFVIDRGLPGQFAHGLAPGTVSPIRSGSFVAQAASARVSDNLGVLARASAIS